jgi:hypothetical protein
VKRLLSGKMLRRFAAAAIGLFVLGAVAAPEATPARGEGTTNIAVATFQNEAGAPPNVISDLSNAAYKAIAGSGKYVAKGGGPLPGVKNLTSDPFVDAIDSAAKAGADEVLSGSVIQMAGGQVYYRLSLYRVAPLTFIGSQIFSQPYPPADAQAMAAAFGSNVATLSAPRQAIGTVYSTTQGVMSDTGTESGFSLGDRFNVMRNGRKVAEATISSIRADDATVTISNASSGYSPAVGDELVGLRALPPAVPVPPGRSTFNALGFFAAVGGVLLAIGHHGQPGNPCAHCVAPSPSGAVFQVLSFAINGHPPSGNIQFTFSQAVNSASQTAIAAQTSYANFVLQPIGSQATTAPAPLSQLGAVTFDPTGTLLTVGEQMSGLVTGEGCQITFSGLVTSTSGASLLPATTGIQTLSIVFKQMTVHKPQVGPVAPGPAVPGGPKPGVGPKGPPPGNPKPGPGDPHVPH